MQSSTSSPWIAQGPTEEGFLLLADQGKDAVRATKAPPALAVHRGQLWTVWEDDADNALYYAATTPDSHGQEFGPRLTFPLDDFLPGAASPGGAIPALANLNGVLHAVIVSAHTGAMVHYLYDADEATAWVRQEGLPADCIAGAKTRDPALVAFHNKLFLAYVDADGHLAHAVFDMHSAAWSAPSHVSPTGSAPAPAPSEEAAAAVATASHAVFQGAPALFVLNGALHLLCQSAGRDSAGDMVGFRYDYTETGWAWSPTDDVSEGKAAKGVSAASYGRSAWLGFVEHDSVFVAAHVDGAACARSNVPFVRTQYLSIAQQLALGIRFLDLRLRAHADGRLYCYHGGMPIGLPHGLSFDDVMQQVFAFIGPRKDRPATETVLVSINNDDKSQAQKDNPHVFYQAVQDAIARTPVYELGGEQRWHTAPVTARLGEVRGKAVLLRRYDGDPAVEPTERIGLDLAQWLDDNPDFTITTPTGVRVHLQDKWKYATRCELNDLVASKQDHVRKMMARAAGSERPETDDDNDNDNDDVDSDQTWFINFCSAVGDPVEHGEVAEAKWIAVGAHSDLHFFGKWVEGMNVRTRDYLRTLAGAKGKKRLGVVNLDYPELPEDSDLVARLIESNF
ncbi:PLC-like phosphodiesterase [Coniella lustricola]|uniref:PLC-like phosphodiesterase n=1 Tax=Coniella lustricola TaxID=2025994 RepID=A0A2T2ZWQ4_9PEZI|nr:PLC-like phosphodiesterase [Coniella lustricola]